MQSVMGAEGGVVVRTDRITEGAAPEKPGGPAKHLV